MKYERFSTKLRTLSFLALGFLLTIGMGACGSNSPLEPTSVPVTDTPIPEGFRLTSPAFAHEDKIPEKYSRDGEDISPPLEWFDAPEGTKSFALIMYSDPLPDGGQNWVHWILFNIPAESYKIREGLTPDEEGKMPDGSQHMSNSSERLAYGGPNPLHFQTWSYYFNFYALDTVLEIKEIEASGSTDEPWFGATREMLEKAMQGHILGKTQLIGKFTGK